MTALRFCQGLIEHALTKSHRIIVFGEEVEAAYDRVHLTDYILSESLSTIQLRPEKWYKDNGIQLVTGCRIASIDKERRSIVDSHKQRHSYDTLVLCTGSKAFVPPIDGVDTEGVFVYRSIDDARAIRAFCSGKSSAVTIGGGLLGLEAANALSELGLQTSIVEHSNGLMSRQLNQDGSATLARHVSEKNLTIHLRKELVGILQFADSMLLRFSDHSELKTDMVVIAAGVRPRDELAQDAGLNCGARGGVIVDDHLQTSDPHIYALGECAMHRGKVYGFVAPCYQMADTLAECLAGHDGTTYQGSDLSCRLKLLGIEVSAFGDYLEPGEQITYQADGIYRMITLKSDRIIGATLVGEWDQTHHLQLAVEENRFMSPIDQNAFRSSGRIEEIDPIQDWPASATICNCMQVTKGQLSSCMESGCKTIDSLSQSTGAGTVCGSCRPLLAQLTGEKGASALYQPKGRSLLLATALAALAACVAILLFYPLPAAKSVQDAYYTLSKTWQDTLYKQISGYSMAGLSVIALLLSARKRIRWINTGNFGWWRAIHSLLGVLCLMALLLHTGLDFGENLNAWLMTCFVGLNTAGAFAGLTLAMEQRLSGPFARRLRGIVIKAHIVFFWPYPALLGFHIYKTYAY